ncbi:hypothetical protein [Thiomicrorhabdus sp. Milos-T2]|uniref:hypothetical protein n=1 Tax=Thiomicrorhabdus sp. Milos-T2 TaxID=90814 RepID=UPI0004943688|nr:hypothetical protein [Thiomicrorhabdus sp. Milos-T2]
MSCYSLNKPASQTEQLNGFWMVSLTLNEKIPLSEGLTSHFYLKDIPNISLALFEHAKDNPSTNYQFLTNQPLPQIALDNSTTLCLESSSNISLPEASQPLLILASNLYIANAFALAKNRSLNHPQSITNVILSTENLFPFVVKPARYLMDEMPAEAIGACTLLEDWKIQNRLASSEGLPGSFGGSLDEILSEWLAAKQFNNQNLLEIETWQIIIFAEKEFQKKCLNVIQQHDWIKHLGTI